MPADSQVTSGPSRAEKLTFYLLKTVNKAIREFQMIGDGDRIAVAVSGGKDSRALLHLLQARQRTVPEQYELAALHVYHDLPGYFDFRPQLEPWFRELGIEYAFSPMEIAEDEALPLPCARCAWLRRKSLFLAAQQMGCNKLALGHHYDDAAHSTLLSLLYSGRLETLAPRREYFGGQIAMIRPLIYVEERRLEQLSRALEFGPDPESCPHSQTSKRAWVKAWLEQSGPDIGQIRNNLWRAARRQSQSENRHQ